MGIDMMCIIYTQENAMRTNIVIDDALLREAFSVSQAKTKKDLIHEALKELIRLRNRKDLTELAGKIDLIEGYDHKKGSLKFDHFFLNGSNRI
jgi:Arc/MetJ family transcription regulator